MNSGKKFRLVTRSDFDGLVCAALLKEIEIIDQIQFVHPKDMQDGKIEITENDITTNLPYVEGVHMAFDHHLSEALRVRGQRKEYIIEPKAPSTARVLYKYLGGKERFSDEKWDEMLEAVDKADSANFTTDEILNPTKWVLLNYIMDPRTGLGRFRNFRISNYDLMMKLISHCRHHSIDEIMELPDVKERVDLYFDHSAKFKEQLKRCSKVFGNLIVINLKDEDLIYAGNRFMVYALYPKCNISMHVLWGLKKQNTVFAIGKSIVNRSSKVNIGKLMLEQGGGGHFNAGTCQVPNETADKIMFALIKEITT